MCIFTKGAKATWGYIFHYYQREGIWPHRAFPILPGVYTAPLRYPLVLRRFVPSANFQKTCTNTDWRVQTGGSILLRIHSYSVEHKWVFRASSLQLIQILMFHFSHFASPPKFFSFNLVQIPGRQISGSTDDLSRIDPCRDQYVMCTEGLCLLSIDGRSHWQHTAKFWGRGASAPRTATQFPAMLMCCEKMIKSPAPWRVLCMNLWLYPNLQGGPITAPQLRRRHERGNNGDKWKEKWRRNNQFCDAGGKQDEKEGQKWTRYSSAPALRHVFSTWKNWISNNVALNSLQAPLHTSGTNAASLPLTVTEGGRRRRTQTKTFFCFTIPSARSNALE